MTQRYGMKASRPGYDATVASDRFLTFNSEWPMPKIIASGSLSIPDDGPITIYEHNLGYKPMFLYTVTNPPFGSWSDTLLGFAGTSQYIRVDDTELKWTAPSGTFSGSDVDIYWYVFDRPITESLTTPVVNPIDVTQQQSNDTYGIKISKEGYNALTETDKRNMTIDTSARALNIHQVSSGTASTFVTETIDHDLGYKPSFLLYVTDTYNWPGNPTSDGEFFMFNQSTDNFFITITDTQFSILYNFIGDYDYSIILFKDNILLT